jgi:hypothetical protein
MHHTWFTVSVLTKEATAALENAIMHNERILWESGIESSFQNWHNTRFNSTIFNTCAKTIATLFAHGKQLGKTPKMPPNIASNGRQKLFAGNRSRHEKLMFGAVKYHQSS